ncbi:hypothetical protein V1515DRAFT_611264 [Lipomyces mesembrius]
MIGLASLVLIIHHRQSFVVVVAPLVLSSSLFSLSCCRRSFVLVVALLMFVSVFFALASSSPVRPVHVSGRQGLVHISRGLCSSSSQVDSLVLKVKFKFKIQSPNSLLVSSSKPYIRALPSQI